MEFSHVQRVRILYKTVLKLHKGLPADLQPLGNTYARDEFKRHKTCNPSEAAVFMSEWTMYAINLTEQLGVRGPKTAKPLGSNLDVQIIEKMREDQIVQLYELLQAATDTDSNPDTATSPKT